MQFLFLTAFSITLSNIPTMACSARGDTRASADLQASLDKASPGDTIQLEPIDYTGDFVLSDKGSSGPITLRGKSSGSKSTRIFGSSTALKVTGGLWHIESLSVASGKQGVVVNGANHLLKSVSVSGTEQGVIIHGDSNTLDSVSISKGDEGVVVKGSRNQLLHVSCSGQTTFGVNVESGSGTDIRSLSVSDAKKYSVIIGESSSDGVMNSLSVDGLLEVRGKSNNFQSLSSSGAVNLLGCGNTFSSASVQQMFVTKECKNSLDSFNFIQKYLDAPYKV